MWKSAEMGTGKFPLGKNVIPRSLLWISNLPIVCHIHMARYRLICEWMKLNTNEAFISKHTCVSTFLLFLKRFCVAKHCISNSRLHHRQTNPSASETSVMFISAVFMTEIVCLDISPRQNNYLMQHITILTLPYAHCMVIIICNIFRCSRL